MLQKDLEEDGLREREMVERAKRVLQGESCTPQEMFDLASLLKSRQRFGFARRLLARARRAPLAQPDAEFNAKLIQQHALCTYKDQDLPVDARLDRALEILREGFDLKTTNDQETLGLAGAIYKRKWEVDAQKSQLERSLSYYLRGARVGVKSDYGYTGINAAFVLDLLAEQERTEAHVAGTSSAIAGERRDEAERIRKEIITELPALAEQRGNEGLRSKWWFLVTVAEAFFGLGRFDEALEWLRKADALSNVSDWEYASTARQLARIAQIQEKQEGLASARAWEVLRAFLGNDANAFSSAATGKVGLALSGGGFRASLFHIGVLARLAELDVLRHVEVLSCVSGGSIIGAHYYLEVRRLLEKKSDQEITREDYIEIVHRIERDFLVGVQRNIRTRVAANWFVNLKTIFVANYSRTERVGELYERELYAKVEPKAEREPLWMDELIVRPFDGPRDFEPRRDNWRRASKVPTLILNAATLNTGHNWQFTATWMGEPPSGINTEIDGNDRLRRLYYGEAPPPHQKVSLGRAVAASSCVPGLFEPVVFDGLYPERVVRLVDGGVHDNQGITALLDEDCTVQLVSDASGQMESLKNPRTELLDVPGRSLSILTARVREAEYKGLEARLRSSLLRGLMFIHLKKDLDVDPVDWIGCDDPHDASDEARTSERRGTFTSYGVRKDAQEKLAAVRTDLDSFNDAEAYALMTSGYRMTEYEFDHCLKEFPVNAGERAGWSFLAVERALNRTGGYEEAHRHLMSILGVAPQRAFRVWKLKPQLKLLAAVLALLFVGAILWLLLTLVPGWLAFLHGQLPESLSEERLKRVLLWSLAAIIAASAVCYMLLRLILRRKTLTQIVIGLVMLTIGFVAALAHLYIFDKIYLQLGRIAPDNERAAPDPK